VLINGESADQISVFDRGIQFGDGLFETIAVQNGIPLLWERHTRRLIMGANRIGIALTDPVPWQDEALQFCRNIKRGVLKIMVTRGISGRGYTTDSSAPSTRVLSILPWPAYPASHARDGIAAAFCRTTLGRNPALAGIKHLNRLEQVLARMELSSAFPEGIMRDDIGHVIEGIMSNLFLIVRGEVRTPDLRECGVAGVMRETVLDELEALGLPHRVAPVTSIELLQADEVFLTNSLIGLWPVRKIVEVGSQKPSRELPIGAMTKRIQQAIRGHFIVEDCA
jgi:4-amino-4-deoxychorismate lyase